MTRFLIVLALGLSACAEPVAAPPERVGTAAAAITQAEAIARAEQWVAAKLQYCQSPNGADDSIDPSCSPICRREMNAAWDPYRSDCSGLVSWAWGLSAPGRTTAELSPNENDITSEIEAASLLPGDAVNTDDSVSDEHHVMLFKAWTTPGQEATFIEEPGCSANPDYAHEFTSAVTLSGQTITVRYNGITFKAIRYGALEQAPIYAASYVSQSWPLSNAAPIPLTVGRAATGSIDMKNTGTATWKAGVVKLAPIPRDHASAFHAASWLSPTRVSTIAADVPPGGVGHFEWDLEPAKSGQFKPYFGLVAEGITWFADSGGPPDDDIQVNVDAAPAATGSGGSTSTSGGGSGSATGGGGSAATANGGAGGNATGGDSGPVGNRGGCAIQRGDDAPATAPLALLALAALALARTRAARFDISKG